MSSSTQPQQFNSPAFIDALRARRPKEVTALVQAYTEQLYRAALGCGLDETAGRELVQSVWVVFFEAVSKFEGRSHIRTYIFGILYNKVSEMKRDQRRFVEHDAIEEIVDKRFNERGDWVTPPIDPEKFLASSQILELIEECLEGLPLSQRTAFYLKQVEEEKSSDICNILQVSRTNLGVLLFRAKNRLRECIEGKTKED